MTVPIKPECVAQAHDLAARLSAVSLADVLDRVEVKQAVEMRAGAAMRIYTIRFFFISPAAYKEVGFGG